MSGYWCLPLHICVNWDAARTDSSSCLRMAFHPLLFPLLSPSLYQLASVLQTTARETHGYSWIFCDLPRRRIPLNVRWDLRTCGPLELIRVWCHWSRVWNLYRRTQVLFSYISTLEDHKSSPGLTVFSAASFNTDNFEVLCWWPPVYSLGCRVAHISCMKLFFAPVKTWAVNIQSAPYS